MALVMKRDQSKKRRLNDDRSTLSKHSDSESDVEHQPRSSHDDIEIEEVADSDVEEPMTDAKIADDTCSNGTDDIGNKEVKKVPANIDTVQIHTTPVQDDPSGFRCVDVNLLAAFISKFPCPGCEEPCFGYLDPKLVVVKEMKIGLASVLEFVCGTCGACQSLTTSAKAGPNYEVNSRFNATMFLIGNDNNKAKRFCSSMKMPEPLPFRPWMNKNK